MASRFLFASFLMVTLSSVWAAGGSIGSGGGVGVDCNSKLELLEVFEAKNDPRISIIQSKGDTLKDYLTLFHNKERLEYDNNSNDIIFYQEQSRRETYYQLTKLIEWHKSSMPLPRTRDTGIVNILPYGCSLVQVAIFADNEHRLTIDQKLWNRLDALSRAALLAHEEIYFYQRQLGEISSVNTRSYLRQMLTRKGVVSSHNGRHDFDFKCFARNNNLPNIGKTDFYFRYKNKANNKAELDFQFISILGHDLLSKSTVSYTNIPIDFKVDVFGIETRNTTSRKNLSRVKRKLKTLHFKNMSVELEFVNQRPLSIHFSQNGQYLGEVEVRHCNPHFR